MRGDKNLRRAGKGAAASKAWDAFTGGPEGAEPAATAAEHVASQGGKDVAGDAAKEAWHTAPWESAKAAFGVKGAAALAAVGGAAAIALVAVATVAVAGGGGDKGGDDGVEISDGGKDGDREIGSGGKDGDETTTSTGSSTTTSTDPGQTTTTARSSTPGAPDPTDPPVTTPPPVTTTRPPATTPPTTLAPSPQIRAFTATGGIGPCQFEGQALVAFSWSGAGTVTAGNIVNTKTGAVVHSGITSPKGSFPALCVDITSPEWKLTLRNGNSVAAERLTKLA